MTEHADAASRQRLQGHLTGSAWLVSADGARALMTPHRKLDRGLQLGGHADGDPDLARVALREAEEESGLHDLEVESAIFDIDRHRIPAHGDEPEHWHYDVRY
ncbi:MAG: NUDIX hydrolase, partial [Dokdonella sp.]